eukprot:IDg19002t1
MLIVAVSPEAEFSFLEHANNAERVCAVGWRRRIGDDVIDSGLRHAERAAERNCELIMLRIRRGTRVPVPALVDLPCGMWSRPGAEPDIHHCAARRRLQLHDGRTCERGEQQSDAETEECHFRGGAKRGSVQSEVGGRVRFF